MKISSRVEGNKTVCPALLFPGPSINRPTGAGAARGQEIDDSSRIRGLPDRQAYGWISDQFVLTAIYPLLHIGVIDIF
jgi:hypothetical protein